jgi:hypothetical protein
MYILDEEAIGSRLWFKGKCPPEPCVSHERNTHGTNIGSNVDHAALVVCGQASNISSEGDGLLKLRVVEVSVHK